MVRHDRSTLLDAFPAPGAEGLQGFLVDARGTIHGTEVVGLQQVGGMEGYSPIVLGVEEGEGQVRPFDADYRENDLPKDLGLRERMFAKKPGSSTDAVSGLWRIGQSAVSGELAPQLLVQ